MLNAQDFARVPSALSATLDAGEKLLWWGIPKQGFVLRRSDATLIPFSLFFLVFAIFWEWKALQAVDPVFPFFGIPFILAGLYITVGRFVHDAMRRRRTVYGVTDKRVLIVDARGMKSIELSGLNEIHLQKTASHVGTIVFGPELRPVASGPGIGAWTGRPVIPTFEFVAEAEKVLNTVRAAKAAAP
ncbi:hypothetical protein [Ferrovibrio sp.]|uniref:hypothetical protein n=1 Tax=Ferrovibrio sp. TaxID=1917215 RepID=UPI003D099294